MHTQAITTATRPASFEQVNPVSAVPVDSEAGFVVPGVSFDDAPVLTGVDGEPLLAGPGVAKPYYTADHLTRVELAAAFYLSCLDELPSVAACPFAKYEAMAVDAVKRVGYQHLREIADLIACPKLAESLSRNERLAQARALADGYLAIADLLDADNLGCGPDDVREGLIDWADMVTAAEVAPMADAVAALPARAEGVADDCDRVSGPSAPLVSALGGSTLAVALYLGNIDLPEAGVLSLDEYEDLAQASVTGLGADSVRELVDAMRLWGLETGPAAWPNPDRFEQASALSRDAADLVRAARYRKTVARFEARL